MLLLFSLGGRGRDEGADWGRSGVGVQGQRGGGKVAHPCDWGVKPEASGILAILFSPGEHSEDGQDAKGTGIDGEPRQGARGQRCVWRHRAAGARTRSPRRAHWEGKRQEWGGSCGGQRDCSRGGRPCLLCTED